MTRAESITLLHINTKHLLSDINLQELNHHVSQRKSVLCLRFLRLGPHSGQYHGSPRSSMEGGLDPRPRGPALADQTGLHRGPQRSTHLMPSLGRVLCSHFEHLHIQYEYEYIFKRIHRFSRNYFLFLLSMITKMLY